MVSGRNTAKPFFQFTSSKSFETDTTLLQSQGVKMDFGGLWKEHGKTIFSIRFCEVFLKLTRRCCRARASRWILVVSGRNTARHFSIRFCEVFLKLTQRCCRARASRWILVVSGRNTARQFFQFASAKSFETDTTLLQSQGFKMDFGGLWKEHGKRFFSVRFFEADTTLLQSQGVKRDFGGLWKEHGKTIFQFASAKSFETDTTLLQSQGCFKMDFGGVWKEHGKTIFSIRFCEVF